MKEIGPTILNEKCYENSLIKIAHFAKTIWVVVQTNGIPNPLAASPAFLKYLTKRKETFKTSCLDFLQIESDLQTSCQPPELEASTLVRRSPRSFPSLETWEFGQLNMLICKVDVGCSNVNLWQCVFLH